MTRGIMVISLSGCAACSHVNQWLNVANGAQWKINVWLVNVMAKCLKLAACGG